MLYSSGTTGYPKGVKRPLPEQDYGVEEGVDLLKVLYGATDESIYLSPAPLYHAAPLAFTMNCIRTGVPVVVMEHEAEFALECMNATRSPTASGYPPCSSACSSCRKKRV